MKTFLVPLPKEIDIRNFLLGDFYTQARQNPEIRLVVFVSPEKLKKYRAKFPHDRCIIEAMPQVDMAKIPIRRLLSLISYASLPTETIWFRQKRVYLNGGSWLAFASKKILWNLGHKKLWRAFLRWVELALFNEEKYWGTIFLRFAPDAVFTPGLTEEGELSMLRYARQKHVPVLVMTRSWDNLTSKFPLRLFPDLLLVQNQSMAIEAHKIGDYPLEDIRVVGFPQFDHYLDSSWRMERSKLAERFGLDPSKKWIIYFTGGLASSVLGKNDYSEHIEMLLGAVERGELPNVSVIARVHPIDKAVLKGRAAKIPVLDFGQDFSFGDEDLKLLSNLVRESAVTINTGSTMTLEAAIFDRPIVLAAFDGYNEEKLPWQQKLSVALNHTIHYQDLERTGGMLRTSNEKELIEGVKSYLENPHLHSEGRKRLREEFVGPLDGGAGRRILEHLTQLTALYKR